MQKIESTWFKATKTQQEIEDEKDIEKQLQDQDTVSESQVENTTYNGEKEYIHFTEMIDGESFGETSLFDES